MSKSKAKDACQEYYAKIFERETRKALQLTDQDKVEITYSDDDETIFAEINNAIYSCLPDSDSTCVFEGEGDAAGKTFTFEMPENLFEYEDACDLIDQFKKDNTLEDRSEYSIEDLQISYRLSEDEATLVAALIRDEMQKRT